MAERRPKGFAPRGVMSAMDRAAAAQLAAGAPYVSVAEQLSKLAGHTVTPTQVRLMASKVRVKKKIAEIQGDLDERVRRALSSGEVLAAEYMMTVVDDPDVDHKLRMEAAVHLLDRMGKRGKPVERSVQTQIQTSAEDQAKALQSALADPAVRKAFGLETGLKQLPAKVAEEVIVGSEKDYEVVPSPTA